MRLERRPGGADFKRDLQPLVAGSRGRKVYETGDIDAGVWTAGIAVGLVHDIVTCEELLKRFESDAEEIVDGMMRMKEPNAYGSVRARL